MYTQGNRNPSGCSSNREKEDCKAQKPQTDPIKGPIQRIRHGSRGVVRAGGGGQCGRLDVEPKYVFNLTPVLNNIHYNTAAVSQHTAAVLFHKRRISNGQF